MSLQRRAVNEIISMCNGSNKIPLKVHPSFSSSGLCILQVLDRVVLSSYQRIRLDCQSEHAHIPQTLS